jgi:hypothetical protein
MALDAKLKGDLERWFNLLPGQMGAAKPGQCPGCGYNRRHDAMEVTASPQMVAFVCERCGHAYLFLLSTLKAEIGISP